MISCKPCNNLQNWVMEYLDRGAWRWGIVSVIFIILRKVFFLARRRNIKHNGHRRAFFHDYSRPGLYMVTMVVAGRQRLFGRIVGHSRGKRGTADFPHLEYSRLGSQIIHEELSKISQFYPMVEVCKVPLMPGDSDYERFHSLNDLAHDICIATDTRLLRIG